MSFQVDALLATKQNIITHRRFALIGLKVIPTKKRQCTVQAIDSAEVLFFPEALAEELLNGQHLLSASLFKLMRYAIGHHVSGAEYQSSNEQQSPVLDALFERSASASLKGQPGAGHMQVEAQGVDAIAMPMGTILGLIPITNPVETLVYKILILSWPLEGKASCEQRINRVRRVLVWVKVTPLFGYAVTRILM